MEHLHVAQHKATVQAACLLLRAISKGDMGADDIVMADLGSL